MQQSKEAQHELEIQSGSGTVEEDVPLQQRLRGDRLEVETGLLLPQPDLVNEIVRDARAPRLIPTAAVRTDRVRQRKAPVRIEPLRCIAPCGDRCIANEDKLIRVDGKPPVVATDEDCVAIEPREEAA